MSVKEYAKEVGCTTPVIYRLIKEAIIEVHATVLNGRFIKDIDTYKYPPIKYRGFYKRGRPFKKS